MTLAKFWALTTSLLLLASCNTANGIRQKMVATLRVAGIENREPECEMYGKGLDRTRIGQCQLTATPEEMIRLTETIHFQKEIGTTDDPIFALHSCGELADFAKPTAVNQVKQLYFLSEVNRYEKEPSLKGPPDENPRINKIYFNTKTGKVCVELQHPYG